MGYMAQQQAITGWKGQSGVKLEQDLRAQASLHKHVALYNSAHNLPSAHAYCIGNPLGQGGKIWLVDHLLD